MTASPVKVNISVGIIPGAVIPGSKLRTSPLDGISLGTTIIRLDGSDKLGSDVITCTSTEYGILFIRFEIVTIGMRLVDMDIKLWIKRHVWYLVLCR